MNCPIDANVISEVRKGAGTDADVASRWASIDDENIYLGVLALGEIRKDMERVRPRDSAKAAEPEEWLEDVFDSYDERILPVDRRVADEWGRLSSRRAAPIVDALLAATAKVHGMALVTRNVKDVDELYTRIINPFESIQGIELGECLFDGVHIRETIHPEKTGAPSRRRRRRLPPTPFSM